MLIVFLPSLELLTMLSISLKVIRTTSFSAIFHSERFCYPGLEEQLSREVTPNSL